MRPPSLDEKARSDADPPYQPDRLRDGVLDFVDQRRGQRTRPGRDAFELRCRGAGGARDLGERDQQIVGTCGNLPDFLDQGRELGERAIRALDQSARLDHQTDDHHRHPDEGDCYSDNANLSDERHG